VQARLNPWKETRCPQPLNCSATIGPIAVDLAPSYLIPDLVVVSSQFRREIFNPWPASAALLVVEVVSRSSRTKDHVLKPALYAEGGIRTYLRIETDPRVSLTAYDLPPGESVYRELGTWGPGEVAHLDVPFAVDIPIDAITP
jgi:Uma2 family endonuclease